VRDELRAAVGAVDAQVAFASARALNGERPRGRLSEVSMYEVDALVRRAPALQRMRQLQNTRSEIPA
jgi:hypothetical protein